MTDELLCMVQEYCTACPIRKTCISRIDFYNEKRFLKNLEEANKLADERLLMAGIPKDIVVLSNTIFTEMITKKRDKELQEHPIYSPI